MLRASAPVAASAAALLALAACAAPAPTLAPGETLDLATDVVLVLHGGAGTIERGEMSAALEREYRATLEAALRAGHAALADGAPAVEGVLAAIRALEDSPLFNAGRGAVLTHDGRHELDASLMVGTGPDGVAAGAVAGVTIVRHPIELARAVMERTPHVLLAGAGADEFARRLAAAPAAEGGGLELVPNHWFTTERRREQLERALAREASTAAAAGAPPAPDARPYLGTVGCVARDAAGRLAAGTSTGGMTNKRWGRVGDAPVLGAGTWADDRTVGVSCTGHGEFFLRGGVAHDVHARMLHGRQGLAEACAGTLGELTSRGGEGGWVALTPEGRAAAPFNSNGMYRGWVDADGRVTVRIWAD